MKRARDRFQWRERKINTKHFECETIIVQKVDIYGRLKRESRILSGFKKTGIRTH